MFGIEDFAGTPRFEVRVVAQDVDQRPPRDAEQPGGTVHVDGYHGFSPCRQHAQPAFSPTFTATSRAIATVRQVMGWLVMGW